MNKFIFNNLYYGFMIIGAIIVYIIQPTIVTALASGLLVGFVLGIVQYLMDNRE